MLNIYVARHGQDEDNIAGILNGRRNKPLTDIGLQQAQDVAQKIAENGMHFNQIYSSPLQRALKTAQIIAHKLGNSEPEVLEDLIERDFGVMTGVPHTEIKKRCAPEILETDSVTYFLEPENGETFPQCLARAKKLLIWLEEKIKDGNILLVSHGDLGKMLYAAYYGLDRKETLKKFYFGNADLILLSHNSASEDAHVFQISDSETEDQLVAT